MAVLTPHTLAFIETHCKYRIRILCGGNVAEQAAMSLGKGSLQVESVVILGRGLGHILAHCS